MRKTYYIFAPIVLLIAFVASYVGGCWTTTPPPPTAKQLASLRDAYLNIPPADNGDLRFAVWGDVRDGRETMEKIIDEVEKDGGYAFTVCSGDMVPDASESNYELFARCALLNWRKTPIVFVPGNHDVNGEDTARDSFYRKYFGATHYSFAVGKTLFVTIDNATEDVFSDQYQWTENLLKTERAKYENLIVFMHMPPFDSRDVVKPHAMDREQGEKLFSLLKEYHTTAIFCGHIHAYEAWNREDIPVWVSGGGGAELMPGERYHYLEVAMHDGKLSVTVHLIK